MKESAARVPAVYLSSAGASILAILSFYRINKLRLVNAAFGFESRPTREQDEWKVLRRPRQ
jgi:hypothetical protein